MQNGMNGLQRNVARSAAPPFMTSDARLTHVMMCEIFRPIPDSENQQGIMANMEASARNLEVTGAVKFDLPTFWPPGQGD